MILYVEHEGISEPCRIRHQRIAAISDGARLRGRPDTTPALIEKRLDRCVLLNDRRFEFIVASHSNSETQITRDGNVIFDTFLARHSRNQRYIVFYRFFSLSSVGQERPRGAQASGPRAHPRPLRRGRGPLRPRTPLAVPQLPPPLPVRHRARGRQGQGAGTYRRHDGLTPLDKLKALPDAARFLRQGVRFDDLDRAAAAHSDLQAAKALNRARDELFRKVHGTVPVAA